MIRYIGEETVCIEGVKRKLCAFCPTAAGRLFTGILDICPGSFFVERSDVAILLKGIDDRWDIEVITGWDASDEFKGDDPTTNWDEARGLAAAERLFPADTPDVG
jgi:hypothetical protein